MSFLNSHILSLMHSTFHYVLLICMTHVGQSLQRRLIRSMQRCTCQKQATRRMHLAIGIPNRIQTPPRQQRRWLSAALPQRSQLAWLYPGAALLPDDRKGVRATDYSKLIVNQKVSRHISDTAYRPIKTWNGKNNKIPYPIYQNSTFRRPNLGVSIAGRQKRIKQQKHAHKYTQYKQYIYIYIYLFIFIYL